MSTVRKAWLVITAAIWVLQLIYVVSPIDLLPDFLPFVGWIDDLGVIVGGMTMSLVALWRAIQDRAILGTDAPGSLAYEPIPPEEIRGL